MLRFRSLPVLAVRRMMGNWRLLSSVVLGTLVAAAIISATAIYADAIRDLGLRFALEHEPISALDVRVEQSNVPVAASTYQSSQGRIEVALRSALGPATGARVRQGRTATFFPAPAGGYPDLDDPARDRANLYFRSDIRSHLDVVAGRLPDPAPAGFEGAIPVALGAATAERLGIETGARLDLLPFWDEDHELLEVEVVGLVRPVDLGERYWGGQENVVDARIRSWDTLLMLVPEATFFGAMRERIPSVAADYSIVQHVVLDGLNARNAAPVAGALAGLEQRLSASETRASVRSDLVRVLRSFDQKLFFTRIPLLVLLLQIGGIAAYYLMMVSTMLVERQAAEIATLRSRGATTGQLLAQYGIEGLILAALAALTGPPIAAGVISALGPTPAFSALSGGGPLDVHISQASYLLAALGALIAFATLMVPAWQATRTTVVEFKRHAARPRPTPVLLRYYLDVAAVLVLAIVFWRLSQEEQLFSETLFGETQADPFLLTTPAVFMLTVGIVFLRLFPLALRIVAWILGKTRSVAVLVGMRSLVRNPTHYTRLILLLMFATGVGMFGATFSATLDRSYGERAAYAVGADVRASDLRALSGAGDERFLATVSRAPAEIVSPVVRTNGFVESGPSMEGVQILGVRPESFGRVSFFREDFAPQPLEAMLATLDDNSTSLSRLPLPPGARQIGVWLKMPDIRGSLSVVLYLRGADGRSLNMAIAFPRPGDPVTEEWRFFAADLERPLNRFGSPIRQEPLDPPISLQGIFVATNSRIAAQRGVMLLGPAYVTAEAPEESPEGAPAEPARELDATFAGAELVHDFTAPAFEVIEGFRPGPVGDRVRREGDDTPPGLDAAVHYSWLDTRRSPLARGLRLSTDGEPVALYLERRAAERLGLGAGDSATLSIASRFMEGRVAGVLELFPTYDATANESFALVDADRLIAAVNASPPDRDIGFNEVWVKTADPADAREFFTEELDAQRVSDVESELIEQQQDPLVAAGWAGILAISFGAVLLLSAIGFVVYSYLTAQERSLEFAILRTLGFSRPQIFAQVLFEHVFVIAAGMGLGSLVGLQIGRYMMDFMATDERGVRVLPPFLLEISWPEIFFVWGVLGTVFVLTIVAVVLLYFRLAVHRALRIGDV